ncbi:hypothetical protein L596_023845 [Steinernema carpocapsae]|uniref:Uncharacterized protein n=1 Tax=Steinernema carpocapsae TaxID=34508 RepID=A0A4U5MEZ1_STECR|nr:hypothetical protein L596_023845 [Steinernema carpocapsae]
MRGSWSVLFLLSMAGYCLASDIMNPVPFRGIADLDPQLVVCIVVIGLAVGSWITMIAASIVCQKFRGPLYRDPKLTYALDELAEEPTQRSQSPENEAQIHQKRLDAGDAVFLTFQTTL